MTGGKPDVSSKQNKCAFPFVFDVLQYDSPLMRSLTGFENTGEAPMRMHFALCSIIKDTEADDPKPTELEDVLVGCKVVLKRHAPFFLS